MDGVADVIDVWMQHPTLRFSQHEMFESLGRGLGSTGQPSGCDHFAR
jgi:hypothetical protein